MIINGRILVDPTRPPEPGWIRTQGDRIEEIGWGTPSDKPHLGNSRTIVTPGFIDAHLHLPQFDSIGHDGLPLLKWLHEHIFPAELSWADRDNAVRSTRSAYRRLLAAGTIRYAGYATSHPHALDVVAEVGRSLPLHAAVGQVLMNRNAPHGLISFAPREPVDDAAARLTATVNPRFAVACDDELLAHAATLANDRIVQTHLAESVDECDLIRTLFPDDPHYTAVYDRHGLLSARTLLAHCLHLSEAEWRLIADRGAVVVHCPTANTFLEAGIFDWRATRNHGVRVALGSDVAAGPDISMPCVARAAIDVAKLRRITIDPDAFVPSPAQMWSLITVGNANALGWTDAGRIEPQAVADLLLLDTPIDPDDRDFVARLLYGWSDSFIRTRVLAGRVVTEAELD